MAGQLNTVVGKEILTTGEAARLCSVTPNTILRWVRDGRLSAVRTSGGHHRIARTELANYIGSDRERNLDQRTEKAYQYCWEFHSDSGTVQEGCFRCIVYRSRSGRCYELAKIHAKVGHSRLHCTKTCENCEYYHEMTNRRPSILVVTTRSDLHDQLGSLSDREVGKIRFVESEYRCCLEIEGFRPDYVVIDCSLGADRCLALARSLSEDTRVPYVRLILLGKPEQFPAGCDKAAFAFVRSPFNVEVLTELIANL